MPSRIAPAAGCHFNFARAVTFQPCDDKAGAGPTSRPFPRQRLPAATLAKLPNAALGIVFQETFSHEVMPLPAYCVPPARFPG